MKTNHKDIPCANHPHILVHITWTERETGPISIRGYAVDAETGVRKDYSKDRKRTARNRSEIPAKQEHLYNCICAEVERHERRAAEKAASPAEENKSLFRIAFEEVESSGDTIGSNWGPDTHDSWLTYFRRNILHNLEVVGIENWMQQDTDDLRAKLLDEILASKKSYGYESVATETLRKNLAACDQIYRAMCARYPVLPSISFCDSAPPKAPKPEHIKSLLPKVRSSLVAQIEDLVCISPRLAIAAVAMYDCGLRTAEAAAVWRDVILAYDDCLAILVQYQVKDGKRTRILKTENAYRQVPLSNWGTAMIRQCLSNLSSTQDGEENLACDVRLLTRTLKGFLVKAGLTKKDFEEATQVMREKPDIDGLRRRVQDVNAYILRHDWASRARNICGLPSMVIDILLGHDVKIPAKRREDLRLPQQQVSLSRELERHVHNPKYSKHPGITPYSLTHSTDIDLIPFDVIRLHNASNEDIDVKLDIESIVNSENILIIAPNESQIHSTGRNISTNCRRLPDTPIIGKSLTKEEEASEKEKEQKKEGQE